MKVVRWAICGLAALGALWALTIPSLVGFLTFCFAAVLVLPPLWDKLGREVGLVQALRRLLTPLILLFGWGFTQVQASDTPEGQAQAAAYVAEQKKAGTWCSGVVDRVEESVQSDLRNPASYERVASNVTPPFPNGWSQGFLRYRAQNGFGGMNVESVRFRVNSETCDIEYI